MMLICNNSSNPEIWTYTPNNHSTAFGIKQIAKKTKAFREHVASHSDVRILMTKFLEGMIGMWGVVAILSYFSKEEKSGTPRHIR